MSDLSEKLILAKNALMLALRDNGQKYLANMKLWFRNKSTKEEFDLEARALLTPDKVHLHNQFLIAILNKIDCLQQISNTSNTLSSNACGSTSLSSKSSSNKRRKKVKLSDRLVTFEPYDICEYLIEDNLDFIQPPITTSADNLQDAAINQLPETIPPQRYCVQELFLPDTGFIMGRFLVGAWENGLVHVDDIVAEYMATAVQVLLKNILTSIILKRKNYKSNNEGNYFYDVGRPMKDPYLKNTISRQKLDDSPIELDKEIATVHLMRKNDDVVFLADCEEMYPIKKRIITIKDVYKALKDRNIIPSHRVYSINMERITQLLH